MLNKRGGVKIKQPTYNGLAKQKIKANYLNYYGHYDEEREEWIYADTAKNCYSKMKAVEGDFGILDDTGRAYCGEGRRGDFGPVRGKNRGPGHLGECQFAFGKIIDNEFDFFTLEENEIRKLVAKMYLTDEGPMMRQQAAKEAWQRGEISEEDYIYELRDSVENWMDFKFALEDRLKCKVGFRLLLEPAGWAKNYNVQTGKFDF